MPTTISRRQKIARVVVGLYLASAAWVLIGFLRAPPDGLANIWTAVWTAPISAIGVVQERWTGVGYPFVPSRFGYYTSHALYFAIAVITLAALLYRLIAGQRT